MTIEQCHAEDYEARLLERAMLLVQAEELCRRLVREVRLDDGIPELDANSAWSGAINTVSVKKGITVGELRSAVRSPGDRTSRDGDDLELWNPVTVRAMSTAASIMHHYHTMSREGGLPTAPAACRRSSVADAPGCIQYHHCGLGKDVNKKASHP